MADSTEKDRSLLFDEDDSLRNVLSTSPNGIVITDLKGKTKFHNSAAEDILDLPPSSIADSSLKEISPEAWDNFKDLVGGVKNCFDSSFCMGDRKILLNQIPVLEGGMIIGILNIFQDISRVERVIGEEIANYRRMIEEVANIVDSSYDGFFITDGEGNVLRVNSSWEKITGVAARDVIGRNVKDLEEKGYFSKSVTMVVLKEKRALTLQKKWFTGKEVLVTANPIFDEDGSIYMVVSNVRDLSDIRRLSRNAERTKKSYDHYPGKIRNLRKRHFEEAELVAESKAMEEAIELAKRVAAVDAPVLISGETGVGKEVIASFIHRNSVRATAGSFMKINCGAIPENLLESELFGYEPGAFTGARQQGKAGIFEAAQKGTILLDEIGELPLGLQVKLLRTIQDFEITRIGSVQPRKIDVRLISVTNRDLKKMVEEGSFRQDLYFRINVVPIYIPPLRERNEDILPLLNLFLQKTNLKYGKEATFSRDVIDYLISYEWPGNVRELINLVERLIVVTPHSEIGFDDLPPNMRKEFLHYPIGQLGSFKKAVRQFEIDILKKAIEKHGSVHEAAYHLKLDPTTIYRKLKTAESPD